jgi:hypothetical protein
MRCKPAIQLWLSFGKKGEQVRVDVVTESPAEEVQLMERVVEQDNMVKALGAALLKRRGNGGCLPERF